MASNKITRIAAIVAMNENRVIGKDGTIPWHLPEDLKRFAALTTGHTVLMGRKTFDSLPTKYKPLPNRMNVVATRSAGATLGEGVLICSSAEDFVQAALSGEVSLPSNELWIIGGAEIYSATQRYWTEVQLTLVEGTDDGDAYFPLFEERFELAEEVQGQTCLFQRYLRPADA